MLCSVQCVRYFSNPALLAAQLRLMDNLGSEHYQSSAGGGQRGMRQVPSPSTTPLPDKSRLRPWTRGESPFSHIPRHAPLVCIVIDLQAIPPRPGANPHYPHLAQHLISTLNQPDNFKKRTREKAIYPAHCRAAKP